MKADSAPPVSISAAITAGSRRPATCRIRRLTIWPLPLRVRPSLRMNMAQTVTTASLLKPDSASCRRHDAGDGERAHDEQRNEVHAQDLGDEQDHRDGEDDENEGDVLSHGGLAT